MVSYAKSALRPLFHAARALLRLIARQPQKKMAGRRMHGINGAKLMSRP
jgi:hypothetical protein